MNDDDESQPTREVDEWARPSYEAAWYEYVGDGAPYGRSHAGHARMLDVLWRYRQHTAIGGAQLTKTDVLEDVIAAAAMELPLEVQVTGKLRYAPEPALRREPVRQTG